MFTCLWYVVAKSEQYNDKIQETKMLHLQIYSMTMLSIIESPLIVDWIPAAPVRQDGDICAHKLHIYIRGFCTYCSIAFSGPPGGMGVLGDISLQSYEISPFRDSSDEDSEDEQKRSQKPIPQWARYC